MIIVQQYGGRQNGRFRRPIIGTRNSQRRRAALELDKIRLEGGRKSINKMSVYLVNGKSIYIYIYIDWNPIRKGYIRKNKI